MQVKVVFLIIEMVSYLSGLTVNIICIYLIVVVVKVSMSISLEKSLQSTITAIKLIFTAVVKVALAKESLDFEQKDDRRSLMVLITRQVLSITYAIEFDEIRFLFYA